MGSGDKSASNVVSLYHQESGSGSSSAGGQSGGKKGKKEKNKSVHDHYRRMSPIQHILHRPELYVGTTEPVKDIWYVPNAEGNHMVRRNLTYSPALFKIFDEIIVNAADNKMRCHALQTKITVDVNTRDGTISVYNDGTGIPVVNHKRYKKLIPELIFGHLLTSSNYDDNEQKITGGRHGYGAKLTNVFSTAFRVETCRRGVYYSKEWVKNMQKSKPGVVVEKKNHHDFTRVTFRPELRRFGLTTQQLDKDVVALMRRRLFDLAATCGVKISWNGEKKRIDSLLDYATMFLPQHGKTMVLSSNMLEDRSKQEVLEAITERIRKATGGVGPSAPVSSAAAAAGTVDTHAGASSSHHQSYSGGDGDLSNKVLVFHQRVRGWDVVLAFHLDGGVDKSDHMSFVNNVHTHNGGTHLKMVQDAVVEHILSNLKSNQQRDRVSRVLKSVLQIFVSAIIPNPSFASQIKDRLLTTPSHFKTKFTLHHLTMSAFKASDLVDNILRFTERELGMAAAKKQMKATNIQGRVTLPKLEDANWAGTDKSNDCTLILTEGDSAKALAISGLAVVGRDKYGVFALRGKCLNAREASLEKVAQNAELTDIMKAMGLRFGEVYPAVAGRLPLRYGRIMIMADQDHDGSHIKGLLINFIHFFWPTLLDVPGFITQFVTPIVKALPLNKKAAQASSSSSSSSSAVVPARSFYSLADFAHWRTSLPRAQARQYFFKYYKGLGTSTAAEGREYFTQIDTKHSIQMVRSPQHPRRCDNAIELAFDSNMIEGRKVWVSSYSVDTHVGVNFKHKSTTFFDFIHKELILFSVADCERSIPNVIDGLKPSQRKVLFGCFKRNLHRPLKVEQLGGYIAEHSAYHHGEKSLHDTIVGLAQDYVGSNNLSLLVPDGQFGTRHEAGKDHASARYIFTYLQPITRLLFPAEDDILLKYRVDDGMSVEPHYYVPVIPLVLVNGASGIGTGFSTTIHSYHPLEVIQNVRHLLEGEPVEPMKPYHEGYTGSFDLTTSVETGESYYTTSNVMYFTKSDTVHISDLTPGMATSSMKKVLVELEKGGRVREFTENHTPSSVSFTVVFEQEYEGVNDHAKMFEQLVKASKRNTAFHTTNMYGFDKEGMLRLFDTTDAILQEHFQVRMKMYQERYRHIKQQLEHQLAVEQSKMFFVEAVCSGALKLATLRDEDAMLHFMAKHQLAKHFPPKQKVESGNAATTIAGGGSDDAMMMDGGGGGGGGSGSGGGRGGGGQNNNQQGDAEIRKNLTGYEYLLRMHIATFNKSNVARLKERLARLKKEIAQHSKLTPASLFHEDLDKLQNAVSELYTRREKERLSERPHGGKKGRGGGGGDDGEGGGSGGGGGGGARRGGGGGGGSPTFRPSGGKSRKGAAALSDGNSSSSSNGGGIVNTAREAYDDVMKMIEDGKKKAAGGDSSALSVGGASSSSSSASGEAAGGAAVHCCSRVPAVRATVTPSFLLATSNNLVAYYRYRRQQQNMMSMTMEQLKRRATSSLMNAMTKIVPRFIF